MKTSLHVTNGDSVVMSLRETELPGDLLAWRDILHEGPVPDVDDAELRRLRANFLQRYTSESPETIERQLAERDALLLDTTSYDSRVLWFEHDLYDQLQLLQILDALSRHSVTSNVTLICIDRFPGVERFKGLGQLRTDQLMTLRDAGVEVSQPMFELARSAWSAFRSDDPTQIEAVLEAGTSALPFLEAALIRGLEQFPSYNTGLSQNEALILEQLAMRPASAIELFVSDWEGERPSYLGDIVFFDILEALFSLVESPDGSPLRWREGDESRQQLLRITDTGRKVLDGQLDALAIRGVDRWLGGVHLNDPARGWRWDEEGRKLRFKVA